VIPFERTFEEGVPGFISGDELDSRLTDPNELSGVLNKAFEAGDVSETESTRRAAEDFRAVTDPLSVWLDAKTVTGPELSVKKSALLTAYNRDCELAGRPPVTSKGFGLALRRLRTTLTDAQRGPAGAVEWVWLGLGLRTNHGPEG
jgi:hypothetical protein